MKLSEKLIEQLQADVAKSSSVNELLGKDGAIKKLVKRLLEEMLSAELSAPAFRGTRNTIRLARALPIVGMVKVRKP